MKARLVLLSTADIPVRPSSMVAEFQVETLTAVPELILHEEKLYLWRSQGKVAVKTSASVHVYVEIQPTEIVARQNVH